MVVTVHSLQLSVYGWGKQRIGINIQNASIVAWFIGKTVNCEPTTVNAYKWFNPFINEIKKWKSCLFLNML